MGDVVYGFKAANKTLKHLWNSSGLEFDAGFRVLLKQQKPYCLSDTKICQKNDQKVLIKVKIFDLSSRRREMMSLYDLKLKTF